MSFPGRGRWLVIAGLMAAGPAMAQEGPAELRWSSALTYEGQQIAPSPASAYWHTVTAGVERKFERGSVAVQGVATRRFDVGDQALVVDAYHELWSGAYGNARVSAAPGAEVLPTYTVAGEIFQTVGHSEISASYRYQEIALAEVNTFGVGLGHYWGNWYLRPRTVVAKVDESWSPFFAFTARRYLGESTDNSLDLSVGAGDEVLEVAPPSGSSARLDVVTSGSRFAAVGARTFLSRRFGVTAGGSYSDYQEIPDRWGVTMGVIARW